MWPVVVYSEACMCTHCHPGLFGILVMPSGVFWSVTGGWLDLMFMYLRVLLPRLHVGFVLACV